MAFGALSQEGRERERKRKGGKEIDRERERERERKREREAKRERTTFHLHKINSPRINTTVVVLEKLWRNYFATRTRKRQKPQLNWQPLSLLTKKLLFICPGKKIRPKAKNTK